jgi:hypothetical protein
VKSLIEDGGGDGRLFESEEKELEHRLKKLLIKEAHGKLQAELARAEAMKDEEGVKRLSGDIRAIHAELEKLEADMKEVYNKE